MSVWSRRIILIICWSRCINIRAFFGSLHCPRVHNLLARWLQLRIDFLPSPLFPAATTKIELWSMRERGKLPRVSGRIPAVKHFMVLLEIKIFQITLKIQQLIWLEMCTQSTVCTLLHCCHNLVNSIHQTIQQ